MLSLKPDLYAKITSSEFEDCYFFEIDLSTESPSKVVEKCKKYHEYYRSNIEQQESGVFPITVWIVPDDARKKSLIRHIREEFKGQPKLFAVITSSELETLIRFGGDKDTLCWSVKTQAFGAVKGVGYVDEKSHYLDYLF